MTEELEGQMTIFDLDFGVGKMYQEHSVPIEEVTTKLSLSPLQKSSKKDTLIYLSQKGDGTTQGWWIWNTDRSHGESLMHSTNYRKDGDGYFLSQILQDIVPERYFLSEKACVGILRRSQKRGKTLPEVLENALVRQAGLSWEKYEELKKEWMAA